MKLERSTACSSNGTLLGAPEGVRRNRQSFDRRRGPRRGSEQRIDWQPTGFQPMQPTQDRSTSAMQRPAARALAAAVEQLVRSRTAPPSVATARVALQGGDAAVVRVRIVDGGVDLTILAPRAVSARLEAFIPSLVARLGVRRIAVRSCRVRAVSPRGEAA